MNMPAIGNTRRCLEENQLVGKSAMFHLQLSNLDKLRVQKDFFFFFYLDQTTLKSLSAH